MSKKTTTAITTKAKTDKPKPPSRKELLEQVQALKTLCDIQEKTLDKAIGLLSTNAESMLQATKQLDWHKQSAKEVESGIMRFMFYNKLTPDQKNHLINICGQAREKFKRCLKHDTAMMEQAKAVEALLQQSGVITVEIQCKHNDTDTTNTNTNTKPDPAK